MVTFLLKKSSLSEKTTLKVGAILPATASWESLSDWYPGPRVATALLCDSIASRYAFSGKWPQSPGTDSACSSAWQGGRGGTPLPKTSLTRVPGLLSDRSPSGAHLSPSWCCPTSGPSWPRQAESEGPGPSSQVLLGSRAGAAVFSTSTFLLRPSEQRGEPAQQLSSHAACPSRGSASRGQEGRREGLGLPGVLALARFFLCPDARRWHSKDKARLIPRMHRTANGATWVTVY